MAYKPKERNGFITYSDTLAIAEKLLERGEYREGLLLWVSMGRYSLQGIEPDFNDFPNLELLWDVIKTKLDIDAESYENKRNINSENGKKGAEKRWQRSIIDSERQRRSATVNDGQQSLATDGENNQIEIEIEKEIEREIEIEKEIEIESEREHTITYSPEVISINDLVNLYNNIPNRRLPIVANVTHTWNGRIIKLIQKYSLQQIQDIFRKANESDYITGNVPSKTHASSFIWIIEKADEILHGKYDNFGGQKKRGRNDWIDDVEL